jgi:hypothetical protein
MWNISVLCMREKSEMRSNYTYLRLDQIGDPLALIIKERCALLASRLHLTKRKKHACGSSPIT